MSLPLLVACGSPASSVDAGRLNPDAEGPGVGAYGIAVGGAGRDTAQSVVQTDNGLLMVGGAFSGSVVADSIELSGVGTQDGAIFGWSRAGGPSVALVFGVAGEDSASLAVTASNDGSRFVSGLFRGTLGLGQHVLESDADSGVFVALMEPGGELGWVSELYSSEWVRVYDMVSGSDSEGGVYVLGAFGGSLRSESQLYASQGSGDVFVARLDKSDGHVEWLRTFGGPGDDIAFRVDDAPDGGVLFGGKFEGAISSLPAAEDAEPPLGGADAVVVRLDADGELVWLRRLGGASDDRVTAIALSGDRLVVAGLFEQVARFGGVELNAGEDGGAFIASVDVESGAVMHARALDGPGFEILWDIVPLDEGNVALGGHFESEIQVDGVRLVSNADEDAVVLGMSSSLMPLWAKSFGASGYDSVLGIERTTAGVVAVGEFEERLEVDGLTLTSNGGGDMFIVELVL